MTENQFLNRTLQLLIEDSVINAYHFMTENLDELDDRSSQVYNFLYCLAASSGKESEALGWLEEAILEEELWYRPEVFEDEDLDKIRNNDRFIHCCKVSEERYKKALKEVKTECTWTDKESDSLVLVLHGNQQNIEICSESWDIFDETDHQVAYLQSEEIDSCRLYRWEDEGSGPKQLLGATRKIEWGKYQKKTLGGFSAGCNVILRALKDYDVTCENVILQSPWIPVVDDEVDAIVSALKAKDIRLLIICGEDDEDCIDKSKVLTEKAYAAGVKVESVWIESLGHDYPEDFERIVLDFLG